jgi:hypothetical protein
VTTEAAARPAPAASPAEERARSEPPATIATPPEPPPRPIVVARAAPPPRPAYRPEEEVRRWLESYASAWRAHDVEALRRMGQVTSAREADALRVYFDGVRDLDVELNVVSVHVEGDHTTVRYTRRDRFRDPAGRLVLKESPLLEKTVVRTSDGFRFARPSG